MPIDLEKYKLSPEDLSKYRLPPAEALPPVPPTVPPAIPPVTPTPLEKYQDISIRAADIMAGGVQKLGGMMFPLLKSLGDTLGLSGAKKMEEESMIRYREMGDTLMERLQSPDLSEDRKQKLVQIYMEAAPKILQSNPSFSKGLKEILGEAIVTGTSAVSLMGAYQATANTLISKFGLEEGLKRGIPTALAKAGIKAGITGTIPGMQYGLGAGLAASKTGKEIKSSVIWGGLIGTGVALTGETVRAFREGVLTHRPANVIQRSFDVPKKWLEKDVFYNQETIAQKMINEGYRGTARQVKYQAEQNLTKYGNQIGDMLKKYPDKTISKSQIIDKIKDVIDDPFNLEYKPIMEKVLEKIPTMKKMSLVETNALKREFADQIPQGYWNAIDPKTAFKGEFYHSVSSALREAIEEATGGAIKGLNSQWATALNTKLLATTEIVRGAGRGLFGAFPWGFIQNILDLTIRAPAVATRSAMVQTGINNIASEMSRLSPLSRTIIINYFNELLQ